MIREHFLELLKSLGFKENGNVLSKSIGSTTLAVDPVLETLIYPPLKIPDFPLDIMLKIVAEFEAKASAAKAINQANFNATKMRNMLIPVPPLKDQQQQRFVKTVESHEAKIIAAEAILSAASKQKAAILKNYL